MTGAAMIEGDGFWFGFLAVCTPYICAGVGYVTLKGWRWLTRK